MYTHQQLEGIKDNYLSGLSLNEISLRNGVSSVGARGALQRLGLYKPKNSRVSKDLYQEICALYEFGISSMDIGHAYNCNHTTVINILKRCSREARKSSDHLRVHSLNKDFFKIIDTENKAYWLGFLFADGCVHNDTKISVMLNVKDRDHLQLFNSHIDSDYPVKTTNYFDKKKKIFNNRSFLQLNCKTMYDNLVSLGCIPRKSLIVKFPTKVPRLLLHHFVRGYFDGDGCVQRGGKNKFSVTVVSSGFFIRAFKRLLTSIGVVKSHDYPTGRARTIAISNTYFVKTFRDYIYKEATVYLKRKKDIFDQISKDIPLRIRN